MQLLNKIFNKIGCSGLILICLFIGLFTYLVIKKKDRINDAAYIKGRSLGINTGVRGHLYLYYSFSVNNQMFNGNVTDDFCKTCSACCVAGYSVIVRYEKDNPQNSDLVIKLPEGAVLEDNH